MNKEYQKYKEARFASFLREKGMTQIDISKELGISERKVRDLLKEIESLDKKTYKTEPFSHWDESYLKRLYEIETRTKFDKNKKAKYTKDLKVKATKFYEDLKLVKEHYLYIDFKYFHINLIDRVFSNDSESYKNRLKGILWLHRRLFIKSSPWVDSINVVLESDYQRLAEIENKELIKALKIIQSYIDGTTEIEEFDYLDVRLLGYLVAELEKVPLTLKGLNRDKACDYEMLSPLYTELNQIKATIDRTLQNQEILRVINNLWIKYGKKPPSCRDSCEYRGQKFVCNDEESICFKLQSCDNKEALRKLVEQGIFSRRFHKLFSLSNTILSPFSN